MLVRERMKALGDHAKSSRQPPVKERKYAKADESAAKPDVIDEEILENGAAHDSAAAVIVDDATPQTAVHENGNGAVAEITPDEEAAVLAPSQQSSLKSGRSRPRLMTTRRGQKQSRKTTTPAPRNAPLFTSGKTGRRYIRMSWGIRMSRNIFSGIWRRKSLTSLNFADYNRDAARNWSETIDTPRIPRLLQC